MIYGSMKDLVDHVMMYGIEKVFKRFYGRYRGEVADVNDDKGIGRLKVKCPAVYGDDIHEEWAFPVNAIAGRGYGIWWLPKKGDTIYVTFENGDPQNPLWMFGWWMTSDDLPAGAEQDVYIFLTPGGMRIELNDKEKTTTITTKLGMKIIFDDNNKSVDMINQAGFRVKLFDDGVFIGRGSANLGAYLDSLFQKLEATTVTTTTGPTPFNNAADYVILHAQLQTFLKTSV